MSEEMKREQMKIVLLGNSGVGKTSLINMFVTGKSYSFVTVGNEF